MALRISSESPRSRVVHSGLERKIAVRFPRQAQATAAAHTDAWNSGEPRAVAAFFASDGSIVIHDGNSWLGRSGIAEMAAGFLSDVPDLFLTCDDVRVSGIKVPWDL